MPSVGGAAVGVAEISQSLINLRGSNRLRNWGVILTTTALGIYVASFLGGGEPLALTSVIIGAIGLGLLLADRLSARSDAIEPGHTIEQTVS